MLNTSLKKCTGCGLCVEKCPKKCINIIENSEGFFYPKVIKPNDCINCDVCNKLCPARMEIKGNEKKYYALQLKDRNLLKKCASGGAFTALALGIINLGGSVCGVTQNGNELKFEIIMDRNKLSKIQGSKYFQCNLSSEIYKRINKLNSNEYFLFSGTPCQVAAIEQRFRRKFKDKLITVEIICQGVPSHKVIDKAYKEIETLKNSKIEEHFFRSKDQYVGRNYLNKYVFSNGNIEYAIGSSDELTKSFQCKIFLRESCYRCNFAKMNRIADFTIGDLWEYKLNNKDIKFEEGVSVIVANTKNSYRTIKVCKIWAFMEEIKSDCIKYNIPFNKPVSKPISRFYSYKLLNTKLSFRFITSICCLKFNIKKGIKKIIKKGSVI